MYIANINTGQPQKPEENQKEIGSEKAEERQHLMERRISSI